MAISTVRGLLLASTSQPPSAIALKGTRRVDRVTLASSYRSQNSRVAMAQTPEIHQSEDRDHFGPGGLNRKLMPFLDSLAANRVRALQAAGTPN